MSPQSVKQDQDNLEIYQDSEYQRAALATLEEGKLRNLKKSLRNPLLRTARYRRRLRELEEMKHKIEKENYEDEDEDEPDYVGKFTKGLPYEFTKIDWRKTVCDMVNKDETYENIVSEFAERLKLINTASDIISDSHANTGTVEAYTQQAKTPYFKFLNITSGPLDIEKKKIITKVKRILSMKFHPDRMRGIVTLCRAEKNIKTTYENTTGTDDEQAERILIAETEAAQAIAAAKAAKETEETAANTEKKSAEEAAKANLEAAKETEETAANTEKKSAEEAAKANLEAVKAAAAIAAAAVVREQGEKDIVQLRKEMEERFLLEEEKIREKQLYSQNWNEYNKYLTAEAAEVEAAAVKAEEASAAKANRELPISHRKNPEKTVKEMIDDIEEKRGGKKHKSKKSKKSKKKRKSKKSKKSRKSKK